MPTLAADDAAILAAWHLGAISRASVPQTGVVHRTLLVESAAGCYALRAYRHLHRAPVEREHALIAYAAAHGIPAVCPVPLPTGGTILARDGRFYALFPRAPGHQVPRARLGPEDLAAMGVLLARLHTALADYPHDRLHARAWATDANATLAGIARLIAHVCAQTAPSATDAAALERLESRRTAIEAEIEAEIEVERAPGPPATPLTSLPFQAIHGDYQDANLFFAEGRVNAVIDWDQAYPAPRAWEVVRVLDLVCQLNPARCRAFLAAYRAGQRLPAADLDLAAAWYGHLRLHDLWLYNAYYFEGNQRLARFIRPGPFVPFTTRWEALVPLLA